MCGAAAERPVDANTRHWIAVNIRDRDLRLVHAAAICRRVIGGKGYRHVAHRHSLKARRRLAFKTIRARNNGYAFSNGIF